MRLIRLNLKTKRVIKNFARSEIILQALLVGLLAGLIAVAFRLSIDSFADFINEKTATLNGFHLLLLPFITALGGLISGWLVYKLAPEAKGSGIPQVKHVLTKISEVVKLKTVIVKFFAGVIGIGSGLSLGREGPSVQLGAGAGSFVAKLFKMTGSRQKKMIASGAAAALAATFNCPLAATIFVLEELVHFFSSSLLFPVLLATVVASTIARHLLGNNSTFPFPEITTPIAAETIPIFVILGILAGFLGVAFSKTILLSIKKFAEYNKIPQWTKPAFAGFITGMVGIFIPAILGTGNPAINEMILGKFSIILLITIFIAKFFLTSLCFGSGATGGLFLPTLMLGSFIGYLTGTIANVLFGIPIDPIVVALVGMGAFLSAVVRTPITAVVIVFEMTGDYNHILPVILSAAIADLIAEKMHSPPIYYVLMRNSFNKIIKAKCSCTTPTEEVKEILVSK